MPIDLLGGIMKKPTLVAMAVLLSTVWAGPSEAQSASTAPIAGQWTYRSYVNSADLVNNNASKALSLIFGEGTMTFTSPTPDSLKGTLDLGGGYVLDITGTVQPGQLPGRYGISAVGLGRVGTPTAGWEYDYRADLAYQWPNGVGQVPALVGSVLRAKAHDGGQAGYVASFIAVRHQ